MRVALGFMGSNLRDYAFGHVFFGISDVVPCGKSAVCDPPFSFALGVLFYSPDLVPF